MNEKLSARITTTDLLCTQDRYSELLNAPQGSGACVAWRNDCAIAQIALLTGEEAVGPVTVSAEDFHSADAVLSAGQIVCTFLKETKAFIGNGKNDNGSRESFPDILYSTGEITIPAHTVQGVWVSFRIPLTAAPGVYHGNIIVSAPSAGYVVSLPFSIEVLDLPLPSPSDYSFDIELWQYPYRFAEYYGVEPFGQKHMELLRSHLMLYRSIGGHAITASIVEEPWNGQTYGAYPSMIKWTRKRDGSFSFDFTDFDKWVTLCMELELGDKIVCYSMIPWANRITYFDEKKNKQIKINPKPGTRRYIKVWATFLNRLIRHTDARGWTDRIYIGIDERPRLEKAYDLIDQISDGDGNSLKKAAAMDHFNSKYFELIDRMESVSVGSLPIKKAINDFRTLTKRRSGSATRRTTVYTCVGHFPNSFTYSMPAESYWTIMFSASLGATGYLRWAYDAWVKDPLRDTTHTSFESGDCFLVYPDEPGTTHPVTKPSVRFEKLAEGMRDINKLLYLARQSSSFYDKARDVITTVKTDYTQTAKQIAVADEMTRKQLPRDMDQLRAAIANISREYLAEQGQA